MAALLLSLFLADPAAELQAARKKAVAFIFDNRKYPVPKQARRGWRVGIDVQKGHTDMERRVAAAIIAHNRWIERVGKKLSVPTRVVGAKRPTLAQPEVIRPVMAYGILVIDTGVMRYLKKPPEGDDRFAQAVGALSRGEWRAAARKGAGLTGAVRTMWKTLRAARVLAWNEQHPVRHSVEEREGMRVVNALRVALGLLPFILDKRLHYAARDFASEMARWNFFSHHHPRDRTRRTLRDRVNRAGYGYGVGENVSTERDGAKAMWKWRADAGHHRLLVRKNFLAAGLGCVKSSVLNVGTGSRSSIYPLYSAGR